MQIWLHNFINVGKNTVLTNKNFSLPNLKVLPYGGAQSIPDTECKNLVTQALGSCANLLDSVSVNQEYLDCYQAWINNTQNNTLVGLEEFGNAAYSAGTTESFDKFYIKNHTRRFRCFRGEYMYHQLAWRNSWPNWKFIENLDIQAGDAVVISMPFADTGEVHKDYVPLMQLCEQLNVPVLIDSAYFGMCGEMVFDYGHKCITDIAFSLSKTFPVSHIRIGMRLTRQDDDDPLLVYHKTNYTNRAGAAVGLALMTQFNSDYIFNKYRKLQQQFCSELNIDTSACVIFGIDRQSVWPQYNRGAGTGRMCFAPHLALGKI
jgi:hypothetical protein